MPTPSRLVVATCNPHNVLGLQAHLARTLQLNVPVVLFEEVPHLLTPETDGDILLVAQDRAEAAAVETVVREAKVQQHPVRMAVVESEPVRNLRLLDHLDPHLAGRWVLPDQTRELTNWARRTLEPGTPFADPATETDAQRVRRRLVNHTPSLTALVDQVCIAAAHDVAVLIEGETGTGKSFLAKLTHEVSPRRAERYLGVACGTLPGHLLTSELFGHADGTKAGKLAAAGAGTVVLDEVDAIGPEQQANLLRLLETGEFEPVGSQEPQVCPARIMAATNWNLAEAVERGTFRRDLYYRLHVMTFHLPPLRHRPEDIGPLVRGMVARYGTKFGKKLFGICPEALRALEAFPWPGNIRQLENVVQQAVLTSSGNELKLNHLSPAIHARGDAPAAVTPGGFGGTLKQTRESSERVNILRALEKAGQSRTRAAQLLGVSRVTLYKKMKRYGLFTKPAAPIDGFANNFGNV